MSGFTENAFVGKLQELNFSQQSIKTLSLWLIHHRKHHAAVVKIWCRELLKVKDSRQFIFMCLANDVIQKSKKKGPEYGKEFGEVLVESFQHMAKTGIDTKTKNSLLRILSIWQERGVYDAQKIQDFKDAMGSIDSVKANKINKRKSNDNEQKEPSKKSKVEGRPKSERHHSETKVEVDRHIETHTTLHPKTPPEPEELIKTLLDLESSAANDNGVRERIESLPSQASEVQLLDKLKGKMTPYYRINTVINLVVRLRKKFLWLQQNKP